MSLSTRARTVLVKLTFPTADALTHLQAAKERTVVTDQELLRRALKTKPPLSYARLRGWAQGCGRVTAVEICNAVGLPIPHVHANVQCPRCGHVFGGSKL